MPNNPIFVSISDYGREIILEVEDSGCGLPSDIDVAKLVDKGVSSKAKNNRGVGLYLVDNLVKQYGGQLDIGNGPTQGVRATVYIPKEKK